MAIAAKRKKQSLVEFLREHPYRTPEEVEEQARVDPVRAAEEKLRRRQDEESLDELRRIELKRVLADPPPRVFIADPELMLDLATGRGVE